MDSLEETSSSSRETDSCPSRLERMPVDIQIHLMLELGDLEELQTLLDAYTHMSDVMIQYFNTIIPPLLRKSMSAYIKDTHDAIQTAKYLYAIVAAPTAQDVDPNTRIQGDVTAFLNTHIRSPTDDIPPCTVPRSRTSLSYMVEVLKAVKLFTAYFGNSESNGFIPEEFYAPDKSILFKHLLILQLKCEIFQDYGGRFEHEDPRQDDIDHYFNGNRRCDLSVFIYKIFQQSLKYEEDRDYPQPFLENDLPVYRGLPRIRDYLTGVQMTLTSANFVEAFIETRFMLDFDDGYIAHSL